MCFGNMEETKEKKTFEDLFKTEKYDKSGTTLTAQWLQDAATGNLGFASSLRDGGFTPYGGKMVAGFSPQQMDSFALGGHMGASLAPHVGQVGRLLSEYSNAGPQQVNTSSIASRMSPYMNQYVGMALAPQLHAQDLQFAEQNRSFDSAATGSGAFGDTGWGLGRSNLTNNQNIGRTGLVGNAYTSAFNTAIGAGAQDVANDMGAQTTNAQLAETALGRKAAGANALYQQGTGIANLLNLFGGQQTAQDQAKLDADYRQYLMAMQYPFQTAQLMNQTIGAGKAAAPVYTNLTGTGESHSKGNKNETEYAPDNSGFGMAGDLAGSLIKYGLPLMFSDERIKENIKKVGELDDGQSVYSFNFKGDPTTHIGLIAQEVEQVKPEAVTENADGIKMVDYAKATEDAGGVTPVPAEQAASQPPAPPAPGAAKQAPVVPPEVLKKARDAREKKVAKKPSIQFGLAA